MDMDFMIQAGYVPGVIGRITELHGTYYKEHWGLDLFFEAKVATELSDFLLHYDESRDGLWYGTADNQIVGSVAIVGPGTAEKGARLRWFIVAPAFRGHGLGRRLLAQAVHFCKQASYQRIYLTTFVGLEDARHLYEKIGFKLCFQKEDNHWGKKVIEQEFELIL
jgi:GNAT superfamily N-acetyltransferase